LAALAIRIEFLQSNLVIVEQLREFEDVDDQHLIRQLVEEHTDVPDDDDAEEIAVELGVSTGAERAAVLSLSQARDMVTKLISFTKAHSLSSEELDLLSLNDTLKKMYNASL
jgi:hypothetical protein